MVLCTGKMHGEQRKNVVARAFEKLAPRREKICYWGRKHVLIVAGKFVVSTEL